MEDCGFEPFMTCVSMGNPHMVVYCGNVAGVPLQMLGPFFERQNIFPERINVHFATAQSRTEVTMRTWERGSGITQACGTGACAVHVAGVLEERLDRSTTVHLPGGDLSLEWPRGAESSVFMTGPAEEVFQGVWEE
jgi:diaminopimelate epimerase